MGFTEKNKLNNYEETLNQLRGVLKNGAGYETAMVVMISAENATILHGGESNASDNLISSFLLIAGVLRQTAHEPLKQALDQILQLQDRVENGLNQIRH